MWWAGGDSHSELISSRRLRGTNRPIDFSTQEQRLESCRRLDAALRPSFLTLGNFNRKVFWPWQTRTTAEADFKWDIAALLDWTLRARSLHALLHTLPIKQTHFLEETSRKIIDLSFCSAQYHSRLDSLPHNEKLSLLNFAALDANVLIHDNPTRVCFLNYLPLEAAATRFGPSPRPRTFSMRCVTPCASHKKIFPQKERIPSVSFWRMSSFKQSISHVVTPWIAPQTIPLVPVFRTTNMSPSTFLHQAALPRSKRIDWTCRRDTSRQHNTPHESNNCQNREVSMQHVRADVRSCKITWEPTLPRVSVPWLFLKKNIYSLSKFWLSTF